MLKSLDSGFHRCDNSWAFSTFDGAVLSEGAPFSWDLRAMPMLLVKKAGEEEQS